jgi:SAM-dependent methyltransferase
VAWAEVRRDKKLSEELIVVDGTMKQDWDTRAQETTSLYIDNRARNEEEFKALGEADAEMILSDIRQYLTPDAAVVEIGCGNGRLLEPMARRFREVWGTDVSPQMLNRCQERLAGFENAHFVELDGNDLTGVPSAHFDLCYSYFTFRHLTAHSMTRRYMEEAYRVLKPGGVLKIDTAGIYSGNPFRQLYETRADTWHGVRFTMSEIVKVLESTGFRMIAAYHPTERQQSLAADESHEDIERQRRLWVVALKSPCMDEWERVCFVTGQALARVVPSGAAVLLPEPDLEGHLAAAGATHMPFVYFDAPEVSTEAIDELERQRGQGAQSVRYLVFTKYGFWWLEIYEEFANHLRSRYHAVEETPDYVLFDLRGHEGPTST